MRFIRILTALLLFLTYTSTTFGQDPSPLLEKANELKYAEKYEDAESLYDQILKIHPQNNGALRGKADCRVMLEPIIPVQHLGIPAGYSDPKYLELLQQLERAKTPWDKRQLEIALDRFALKYTGQVYTEDTKRKEETVETIIKKAEQRIKAKEPSEIVYLETSKELLLLQKQADQSWKGHGPEILGPALEKLDKFYADKKLPNPSQPLLLSLKLSPENPKKGEEAEITATLKNRLSFPIILIDFQIEGQDYTLYSFQRSKYGSLTYDKEKDQHFYNGIAQQETPALFNFGLLLPGQTTSFVQNAYWPDLKPEIRINFHIIDDETINQVYVSKNPEGINEVFAQINMAEFRCLAESKSPEVIFDDSLSHRWTQFISLDSRLK